MTAKPHDVVAFREYTNSAGEPRTDSTRIGVAWPSKNGNLTLKLEFVPTDISNTKIMIMVAKKAEPDTKPA